MTGHESESTTRLGFDCPNCGETTVFEEGVEPDDIKGRPYKCEGCGVNILMEEYVGDREAAR